MILGESPEVKVLHMPTLAGVPCVDHWSSYMWEQQWCSHLVASTDVQTSVVHGP